MEEIRAEISKLASKEEVELNNRERPVTGRYHWIHKGIKIKKNIDDIFEQDEPVAVFIFLPVHKPDGQST